MLSGNVSKLHVDPDGTVAGLSIVTASVDQVHVQQRLVELVRSACAKVNAYPINPPPPLYATATSLSSLWYRLSLDHSYKMHGRVTWVGSSSMEVYVGIFDKDDPSNDILVCNYGTLSSQCISSIRTRVCPFELSVRVSKLA